MIIFVENKKYCLWNIKLYHIKIKHLLRNNIIMSDILPRPYMGQRSKVALIFDVVNCIGIP